MRLSGSEVERGLTIRLWKGAKNMGEERAKFDDIINGLEHGMALSILFRLSEDNGTKKKILALAKAELKTVDVGRIADSVFNSLNSIDVEVLWENSGRTYHGYVEPSELAHEMAEDSIYPYVADMKKYRTLKMKSEEKSVCIGIVKGLMLYDEQSTNEFSDWIPDGVGEIADSLIDEYAAQNAEADIVEIRAIRDAQYADCGDDENGGDRPESKTQSSPGKRLG
jgi:hypothetical protein